MSELHVRLARSIHVRIIERVDVPPLWRHLAGGVEAVAQGVPVLPNVVRQASRVAASVTRDAQHATSVAAADHSAPSGLAVRGADLRPDELNEVGHGRVVEHERRRQRQTLERGLQTVPELDARERVQAHLHERRAEVELHVVARQAVFEHSDHDILNGVLSDAVQRHGRTLLAAAGAELAEVRRHVRHLAEQHLPLDAGDADGAASQVHANAKDRLHGLQALDDLDPRDAALARAHARGHADVRPGAPLHADRGQAPSEAPSGERIHEGVGGTIVGLAHGANHRRDRREHPEVVQCQVGQRLVQVERTVDLG
mmetsp:Transcript_134723/g.430424  ORF Transcript_134723/g.430424 Transcript_134723/m.430424 type:complete len:313 (-) Transcript_134723:2386-3324(-)